MQGDPIHERTIEVDVGPEADGRREVRGRVQDRRHQGHTYTGSMVIGPGVVHDMSARLVLDLRAGSVESASGTMDRAAFDGSAETGFESCRDILPNVADLAGIAIDERLPDAIRRAIGRERGCYHLTTLCLAMAPVVLRARRGPLPPGDAAKREIRLLATHAEPDVRFSGTLVDRLGSAAHRAGLAFTVVLGSLALHDVEAYSAPDLTRHREVEATLCGMPLVGGFARAVRKALTSIDGASELVDLALNLNAIFTQGMVLAPTVEVAAPADEQAPTSRALGTCYMWRSGGAAERLPTGRLTRPARPGGQSEG
jgi:hypothetical protein